MQKTLFDDERPAKIARASDPETSQIAAAEVKAGLLESRMLGVWRHNGPMTSNEAAHIAARVGFEGDNRTTADTYRKRYDALVKKDLIEADGKKKCSVTGKLATVYKIKDSQ